MRGVASILGSFAEAFDSPEESERRLQERMREIERDAEEIRLHNEELEHEAAP